MEYTNNTYFFIYAICILQIYLAVRYAVKAVTGHVENYNILKLAMVLIIPIFGYYYATKEEVSVS
jgi:NADH:ubiquinone oxidoreductase subunit 3 (subunit A)